MEAKRISVIIPTHNSERHLSECLDSVFQQVDSNDEVVIIDDASTDNTLSVCNSYLNQYPNIIRIIRKNKQTGPSDSRNIGKECALGSFVCFIDSDDWLASSALMEMYLFATDNDCDVVQTAFYYAFDDYLLLDKRMQKIYQHSMVISKEQAMTYLINNNIIYNFVWGKLYKSEIVKKYKFPSGISMGEDLYWQHKVIHETNRVGILPIPLYYYRQNSHSISNIFSERHITLLYALEDRLSFINKFYPHLVPDILYVLWKQSYQSWKFAKINGTSECERLFYDYWVKLNEKYHYEFDRNINKKTDYFLYSQSITFLNLYYLIKRLLGRFVPNYIKIPVK